VEILPDVRSPTGREGGEVMYMKWEDIDPWHRRAKVPGGWLVKATEDRMHDTPNGMQSGWDWDIAMCFLPDSNHTWIPIMEKEEKP